MNYGLIERVEDFFIRIAYDPDHDESVLWFWPRLLAELALVFIDAFFCFYTPVSWVEAGRYESIRIPFFIYWPLKCWRDLQIGFLTWKIRFLTWKIRNRDRVT